MRYYSPITIKEEKQPKAYERVVSFPYPVMSLDRLKVILKDGEVFTVDTDDYGDITLHIYGTRIETDKERDERVKGEKAYMKAYNKFHNKKS